MDERGRSGGGSGRGAGRRRLRPIFESPRLRSNIEGPHHTTWLEFFFDLVFVVAVDQVARRLQGGATPASVAGYVVLSVPIWWAWVSYVSYSDRFGTDDLGDRLLTLVQMAAVTVLAVRAHDALEGGTAAFAIAYACFRLVIAVRYLLAARHIPDVHDIALREGLGFGLAALLWLLSAFVDAPVRYALWVAGFCVDLGTPLATSAMHLVVPPDGGHFVERFGTLINIVLGEGFVGLVEGLREVRWSPVIGATAALSLLLGFSLWWVYFDSLDESPMTFVRLERRTTPYKLWVYSHLPLAASIAAGGIAIADAIRRAAAPILPGSTRWLLSGAIGVFFLSLAVVHVAYAMAGGPDRDRALASRQLAAAALALLVGAMGESLSSVAVMGLLAVIGIAQVVDDLAYRVQALRSERVGGAPVPARA